MVHDLVSSEIFVEAGIGSLVLTTMREMSDRKKGKLDELGIDKFIACQCLGRMKKKGVWKLTQPVKYNHVLWLSMTV